MTTPHTTLVLPEATEGEVSSDLRYLTRLLVENRLTPDGLGGGFGGEDGYGVHFENDTFLMHPYCWCGSDSCPWCTGCQCVDGSTRYFLAGGTETDADTFYDNGGYLHGTTEVVAELQCPYCKGLVYSAPNFFHRPSGSRVYWYKYLGRSMEMDLGEGWKVVFDDCIRSLTSKA